MPAWAGSHGYQDDHAEQGMYAQLPLDPMIGGRGRQTMGILRSAERGLHMSLAAVAAHDLLIRLIERDQHRAHEGEDLLTDAMRPRGRHLRLSEPAHLPSGAGERLRLRCGHERADEVQSPPGGRGAVVRRVVAVVEDGGQFAKSRRAA